jgi:hypothetical protein
MRHDLRASARGFLFQTALRAFLRGHDEARAMRFNNNYLCDVAAKVITILCATSSWIANSVSIVRRGNRWLMVHHQASRAPQ